MMASPAMSDAGHSQQPLTAQQIIDRAGKLRHGFVVCTSSGRQKVRSTGCYVRTGVNGMFERDDYVLFEWNDYVVRVTGRTDAVVTGIAVGHSPDSSRQAMVYFVYPAEGSQ